MPIRFFLGGLRNFRLCSRDVTRAANRSKHTFVSCRIQSTSVSQITVAVAQRVCTASWHAHGRDVLVLSEMNLHVYCLSLSLFTKEFEFKCRRALGWRRWFVAWFCQEPITTPDGFFFAGMLTFVSYALCLSLSLHCVLSGCAGLCSHPVHASCVFLLHRLCCLLLCRGWCSPGRPRWMFASCARWVACFVMDSGLAFLPSTAVSCWMLLLDLPMRSGLLPCGSSFGS